MNNNHAATSGAIFVGSHEIFLKYSSFCLPRQATCVTKVTHNLYFLYISTFYLFSCLHILMLIVLNFLGHLVFCPTIIGSSDYVAAFGKLVSQDSLLIMYGKLEAFTRIF